MYFPVFAFVEALYQLYCGAPRVKILLYLQFISQIIGRFARTISTRNNGVRTISQLTISDSN